MIAVVALEALVLVVMAVLVTGLLRSHAVILRRLHELDGASGETAGSARTLAPVDGPPPFRSMPGMPEPVPLGDQSAVPRDIVATTLDDEAVVVRTAGVAHDTVLAFLSSSCTTCLQFWDDFARPVALPATARLLIVVKDLAEESPSALHELRPDGVDVLLSSQAWNDYRVPGSPYVMAVDGKSGRVKGEGTGMSWEQVANLLAQSTGDAAYLSGGRRPGLIVKPTSDADREQRVDRELLSAGISPGDPSLYASPVAEAVEQSERS